jgi:signal transduction histidine kinase
MSRVRVFMKRHTLWVAFVAVLAPLVVLVGLQYVWLTRLARASAIAHQAAMSNYLEAIGSEVQYFYRAISERALNVPASLFTQDQLDKVARHWRKKPVEGIARLFLVDFTRSEYGNFLLFDERKGRLISPYASEESLAIIAACSPWQIMSYQRRASEAAVLRVDERNPRFRIILNPITDDASMVVGVAGMIVDQEFMMESLLPKVIEKSLPKFFPESAMGEMVVTVSDNAGERILSTRDEFDLGEMVSVGFPFIFEDWTVELHSPPLLPKQWARTSFAYNMSLSLLLAGVLLGGIVLALRSANRAMILSEMKGDFVSNVSHELRTPLASIRVFAELLRLGRVQSPAKAQEYGEFIEAESRRLSRLIDNILDFSRIETGRKTYRFVPADIHEVVESTLKTFEVHLKHGGFRIAFEGGEEPLPEVAIDQDAIAQALHNLLDNAVKYSGDSREIGVRLTRESDAVVIAVRDHGIGIPREEQRKIFDRFHRVGTGLVHDVKGSGLGLSIVQHVVEVHQGQITVESEPGNGSTFSMRIPLSREPSGVPQEVAVPAPGEAADLGAGTRA